MAFEIKSENVNLSDTEKQRIADALEALTKDPHAPRELTVTVTLHVHNEFPKTLYKGKQTRVVADPEAEQQAAADGFGPYDHEAYTATEKAEV
jgi:ribosome-associated translation inhibitor RaiA